MSSWKSAYESLTELSEYRDNALGLFALGLKFGLDDLASIGVDAITDGSEDKKIDMVYINTEEEYAVIGQCYFSLKDKISAPSNKASDLNIELAWLLQRNIDDVPERIRSAAINLRKAIKNKEIKKLYLWYVHNLPESHHVKTELVTLEQTARTIFKQDYATIKINIFTEEIGNNTITELYEECKTPILISEEIKLLSLQGYEISSNGWSSYSTAIHARQLARLYKKHHTKIFSANIRDYLGSRKSDSNINNGIKQTIESDPKNFWAYNNGLTILTHKYKIEKGAIIVQGLSIVNGAQTTGAIGSLKKLPDKDAMVQARFIAVDDASDGLIDNIIRYNNSQNKVEAADFRSTDKIQKRLKEEFKIIPNTEYEGGRRGSSSDAIRRRPDLLASYTVGQALAAFHGEPITAYNKKAGIWINNKTYEAFFNDNTKASHIVCCYALVRAIENKMKTLKLKTSLTTSDEKTLNFLRQRGAIFLATHAIARSLEIILDRSIPSLFKISFGSDCPPKKAIELWSPILDAVIPLAENLNPAVEKGLTSSTEIESSVNRFNSIIQSIRSYHSSVFDEFKKNIQAP